MANWDPKLSIHLEEAGKIDYEECFCYQEMIIIIFINIYNNI